MEAKIEIITPELAEIYLGKNSNNYRKISRQIVLAYAADMKTGNWKLNGEAIKFNESGFLVDGQHRLNAVVRSGVSVPMLVIRGVEDDVQTYDIGKGRSVAEIASAQSLSYSVSNLATIGAASLLFRCVGNGIVAKQQILELIKNEEDLWSTAYLLTTVGNSKTRIAKKAAIILAVYVLLLQRQDEQELSLFFRVVNTGFPVQDRDCSPAIVLRNYLLSDKARADSRANTGKFTAFSATLNAFKDFVDGSTRKKMYRLEESHIAMLQKLRDEKFRT